MNNQRSKISIPSKPKLIMFLAIVAVLLYVNTLRNGYVLDDAVVVTNNNIVNRGISAIPEILATPYHYGVSFLFTNLYRPLPLIMFAVEYQLSGNTPLLSHLINVLFFAACVVLLFLFLDRLLVQKQTTVAFIAALLFALHPIHTEVVANIKSRDELLCFFFCFCSLYLFLIFTTRGLWWHLLAGMLCLFAGLLSKETAVTFAGIIPLVFLLYINENKKRSVFILSGAAVVFALYFIIRIHVLSSHDATEAHLRLIDNELVNAPSAAARLATAILVLGGYIKLLIIPYPLVYDYSYQAIPFADFSNVYVLISLALYVSLAAFSIYRLFKYRNDALAFAILFFLVTISLFSNTVFLTGALMAERFVFFASAGFCLAIAIAIDRLLLSKGKSGLARALLATVSLVFAFLTIKRNTDWKDNYTLYLADSKKSTTNYRLYFNLGTALCMNLFGYEKDTANKRPLIEEGIVNLERSLAIYPENSTAEEHIGRACFTLGQLEKAAVHYERALALDHANADAFNKLMLIYFNEHQYRNALSICQNAFAAHPNISVYNNMGTCYLRLGKYDSALVIFRNILLKNPEYKPANANMARLYLKLGNADSVARYETIAGVHIEDGQ